MCLTVHNVEGHVCGLRVGGGARVPARLRPKARIQQVRGARLLSQSDLFKVH
jgi:hypothetical protein